MIDFKNLNTRLLVINLAVFFAALLLNDPLHFFESSYETSKKLVNLESVSDVHGIDVKRNNQSEFQLLKSESGWTVKDSKSGAEFAANTAIIESNIERIMECRKYYEVTGKAEKFAEYELDDNDLVVELRYKKKTAQIVIGKQGSTFNTSLVRLKDEKTVYSVRGNLSSDWNQDIEHFRNKKLFSFTKDNMKSVIATGPKNYEIYSGDNNEWFLKLGNRNVKTNSVKINRLLDDIAQIEGLDFYHNQQEGVHYASINIMLSSNISFNLQVNKVGKDFIIKSDANPFWQSIAEYRINTLFPSREEIISSDGGQ